MKKVALCFIISYTHEINKEHIWKKWIEPNSDIINVYFHYKNYDLIKSEWIKSHIIPSNVIQPTSYYHVVCAYMALLFFAYSSDSANQWFCMLSDSCVPIVSPAKFRKMFFKHYSQTIMKWRPAYWNIDFHKRANLKLLPPHYRLAHDPWFIVCKEHVAIFKYFVKNKADLFGLIDSGGLANESLFAIILQMYGKLEKSNPTNDMKNEVINEVSTITDWTRRINPTSPYMFNEASEENIAIIKKNLRSNIYSPFLRKVGKDFSDNALESIIYGANNDDDNSINNTQYFWYTAILSFILCIIYGMSFFSMHII